MPGGYAVGVSVWEGRNTAARVLTQLALSLTITLRTPTPSEQQVHSKVSLRCAVDTVHRRGVCSNRPHGFGEAARRASSLRT
jgi:hypothetical protein